jgi:hypothetical protein
MLDVALLEAANDRAPDGEPPGAGAAVPLRLRVHLSTVDGTPHHVDFPTLASGRHRIGAVVQGCPAGCRLVALQVTAAPSARLPAPVTVEIHELTQRSAVLGPAMLGDVARWRTTLVYPAAPPEVAPHDNRLAVTLGKDSEPGAPGVDGWVVPLTAPAPLPVVVAGEPPQTPGAAARIAVLSGRSVPFRVAARVPVLPHLGDQGVLADLEYALRSSDTPVEPTQLWVWLNADAPDAVVAGLAGHGVTVRGDESVAARTDEFASGGPGLALLFAYFAAAVVLLLAAGVAVVGSTVERADRVAELVALREQGLPAGAVRTAGIAGAAALVGAATVTGVLAAVVAQALVTTGLPIFSDDWAVLPVPAGMTPATLAVSAGVVLLVTGVAALWAAGRLVAAVAANPRTRRRLPDAARLPGTRGSAP